MTYEKIIEWHSTSILNNCYKSKKCKNCFEYYSAVLCIKTNVGKENWSQIEQSNLLVIVNHLAFKYI